jgi:hypothetical protein
MAKVVAFPAPVRPSEAEVARLPAPVARCSGQVVRLAAPGWGIGGEVFRLSRKVSQPESSRICDNSRGFPAQPRGILRQNTEKYSGAAHFRPFAALRLFPVIFPSTAVKTNPQSSVTS